MAETKQAKIVERTIAEGQTPNKPKPSLPEFKFYPFKDALKHLVIKEDEKN